MQCQHRSFISPVLQGKSFLLILLISWYFVYVLYTSISSPDISHEPWPSQAQDIWFPFTAHRYEVRPHADSHPREVDVGVMWAPVQIHEGLCNSLCSRFFFMHRAVVATSAQCFGIGTRIHYEQLREDCVQPLEMA